MLLKSLSSRPSLHARIRRPSPDAAACTAAHSRPAAARMRSSSVRIADLKHHVGATVTVRGWVAHLRSSGKVAFVVARDGTGIMQAVLVKSQVSAESWEAFGKLTTESSISLTGEVRAEARAPGGYELGVASLEIIGASPLD